MSLPMCACFCLPWLSMHREKDTANDIQAAERTLQLSQRGALHSALYAAGNSLASVLPPAHIPLLLLRTCILYVFSPHFRNVVYGSLLRMHARHLYALTKVGFRIRSDMIIPGSLGIDYR